MIYDQVLHQPEYYKRMCAGGNLEGIEWDPTFNQQVNDFRFHFDDPTRPLPWPIRNRPAPDRRPIVGGAAGGAARLGAGLRAMTDQERQQMEEERALGMDMD